MKFKFKVLITNIIVLSIAMGTIGYFMIKMNFDLALNTLIDSAISENNLAQTYVEYDLLEYINNNGRLISDELQLVRNNLETGLLMSSELYINYDNKTFSSDSEENVLLPQELLDINEKVSKNYIICEEDDAHYIYVASCNEINNKYLHIVTKKSVEDAFSLLDEQFQFFRMLLISIVSLGCIFVFIIASILTKPLEKLNKVSDEMADGNYSMRASIHSTDEVGQLAAKFNHMAASVDKHVKDLEQQVYRREQFVADFTHEIKTPMTTIIGYADTMRSIDLPREDQITSLNYIVSAGKRLETMSRKLFELIYLNRHEIDTSPIKVSSFCQELYDYISPAIKAKNISLKMDIENAFILGNRELLTSAFINFLDNARKASYENSVIELVGHIEGSSYSLSVIDHGIGMAKEHLDKICDEFYMVDKSRSRNEGSAGLGLSLASLIINRHGGLLNITSKEKLGTTIQVTLPLCKEEKTDEKN